jgi:hypothetical protein
LSGFAPALFEAIAPTIDKPQQSLHPQFPAQFPE